MFLRALDFIFHNYLFPVNESKTKIKKKIKKIFNDLAIFSIMIIRKIMIVKIK